ncbi:MAG: hypothetical protein J5606_09965 [Bacteroidales bacterium]|nr:hypothetical protein [Bacteroidales bacterium]
MKINLRFINLLFLLVLSTLMSAQDIIVTKASKKIDAKIIKVTKEEVEYKKHTNLDGPTFVIPIRDISSIIYTDGEVQLFENHNYSLEDTKVRQREEDDDDDVDYGDYKEFLDKNNNDPDGKRISKVDNSYFINGEEMDEQEYLNFIAVECPVAYRYHQKGISQYHIGMTLITIGGSALVLSSICYLVGATHDNDWAWIAGGVLDVAGLGCLGPGIPLVVKGKKKKNHSYQIYNKECSNKLSLSLQPRINGMGVRLSF